MRRKAQLEELRTFVTEKTHRHGADGSAGRREGIPALQPRQLRLHQHPGPVSSRRTWRGRISSRRPIRRGRRRSARSTFPGVADLLFTSVHEVWPGHFLQFQHAVRNPSKVAGMWVGYAYAEGWAHYAEEMMWEIGLGNGDPEMRIGQLTNALLRNVRYLSAIGLHTQGMTVAQSEKMFRDSAFADAGTARQQAARGTYDPAYLNYTLGKLMIRKLRTDWMAANPPAAEPSRGLTAAMAGLPRQVPVVRRPADSAGSSRDARHWRAIFSDAALRGSERSAESAS